MTKPIDLAIVSMACRFPGAKNVQEFWLNLAKGKSFMSAIPADRWDAEKYFHPTPAPGKSVTTKGYFIDGVKDFDPGFFNFKARDVTVMDPQQRILLELSYEAFASIKYDKKRLSGQKMGVFMGITKSDYQNHIVPAILQESLPQRTVAIGILENLIAARIANYFDLNGPALTVDTACSSSLVALHMAKESILSGTCDSALVGGINLNLTPPVFVGMSYAGALSSADQYYVFDKRAQGFFMGEGGGVILLKKHAQALADGDPILGLLRGTSINNDGRSVSPMAPRTSTQQMAIWDALKDAELQPTDIDLIEAHGTGTPLGDAMEAQTLRQIFKDSPMKPYLGSVKPNIGHLLSAAGVGSIIKVLLSFQHQHIPPLPFYEEVRDQLLLESEGFKINTRLEPFVSKQPIVGLNSFGFGGTNAHVILQAPITPSQFEQVNPPYQKQSLWVEWTLEELLESPREESLEAKGHVQSHLFDTQSKPSVKSHQFEWFSYEPSAGEPPKTFLILTSEIHHLDRKQLVESLRASGHICITANDLTQAEIFLKKEKGPWVLISLFPLGYKALYQFLQNLMGSPLLPVLEKVLFLTRGALPLAPSSPDHFLESGLIWGAMSEIPVPIQQLDLPFLSKPHFNKLIIDAISEETSLPHRAIRDEQLWFQTARESALSTDPPLPTVIQTHGVYLVTGGASGLGAEVALSLAQKKKVTLILVGRRKPLKHPTLPELQRKIETMGSSVAYFSLDTSQSTETQALIQVLEQEYGRLDGIVHAAGTVSPGGLLQKPFASLETVLAPKVKGLQNLRQALLSSRLRPGFFVAFSSLSSVRTGYGRGLIDYVAANHFMDSFANHVAASEVPIQVLQWGPWASTGMAKHPALLAQFKEWGVLPLLTSEGLTAFHQFINGGVSQALVLKTALSLNDLKSKISPPILKALPKALSSVVSKHKGDLKSQLLNWVKVALSQEGKDSEIGLDDNLLDLGLDSLTAIDLTKKLGEMGFENLPFELLFEQQTVRELAEYLDSSQNQKPLSLTPSIQPKTILTESGNLETQILTWIQAALSQEGQSIQVGLDDNLLDLGLDSLTAIDLTKKLGEMGFENLPFELLFEQQTVRELVTFLEPTDSSRELTPIQNLNGEISQGLSPIQGGFYLGHMLTQGPNFSYFMITFQRQLDPTLLNQALAAVISKHGQLRTSFHHDLKEGEMIFSSHEMPFHELQKVPEVELLPLFQPLKDIESEFVNRPFDLGSSPLCRIGLLKYTNKNHLLLLFHHIVFDGVSMVLVLKEFWGNYRLLEQNLPLDKTPPELTYSDYILAVDQFREGPVYEKSYETLKTQVTSLDNCHKGEFFKSLESKYQALTNILADALDVIIPKPIANALISLSTKEEVPLQMLYLSAFFSALKKWTDSETLVIQLAISGRHWPLSGIHQVIGSFAEIFPLIPEYPELKGLPLARHLRTVWNSSKPLHKVGADNVRPLFTKRGITLPFSFSFAHFDSNWVLEEDSSRILDTRTRGFHSNTQLGLLITQNTSDFHCAFNFPIGLFSKEEVNTLYHFFESELKALASLPTPELEALTFHPDLADQNSKVKKKPTNIKKNIELEFDSNSLIEGVWGQFLKQDSSQLAIKGNTGYSYQDLVSQALKLATVFQSQGCTSGSVIAYQGAPGYKSLAALLACFALGATWLPLDPRYPNARCLSMCEQAQAKISIKEDPNSDFVGQTMDSLLAMSLSESPIEPLLSPQGVAYIIFTSGSTGAPKGVPIAYRALNKYLNWALVTFEYTSQDKVLWLNSIAFDASLRQMLAPLMAGATLYPISSVHTMSPHDLLTQASETTVWSGVPSLLQLWIQALDAFPDYSWDALRLVQVGGEVLSPEILIRWQRRMGEHIPIVNLYGPTEITLNATAYWVRGPWHLEQPLPIGSPLPHVLYRIFHEGKECLAGQTGELWLGGPTLTSGYLQGDDSALFCEHLGQRFYRTGDLVSESVEGVLSFHGRMDRQVKLRGFRIELEDIENQLLAFNQVNLAHVQTAKLASGHVQLQGFVQLKEAIDIDELTTKLHLHLPDYMVPEEIYILNDFPVLPNGKRDLKGFSLPTKKPSSVTEQDLNGLEKSPEGHERFLNELWTQVLKCPSIALNDDFFKLGGDSLLLMQVYLQMQKKWPQLPPMASFYKARRFDQWLHLISQTEDKPLPNEGIWVDEFELSPSQMGFYLWDQHLGGSHSLWKAVIKVKGVIHVPLFEKALESVGRRHQLLMSQLQYASPPVFKKTTKPYQSFKYFALGDSIPQASETFDIFNEPLLQHCLVQTAKNEHQWQIRSHHLLADGLSAFIFGHDVFRLYDALVLKKETDLVPLKGAYSDYVNVLKQDLLDKSHLSYWLKVFRKPFTPPVSTPASGIPAFYTLSFTLSNPDTLRLKKRAQNQGVSLSSCILEGYYQGVKALTEQSDLVIGVAHHGRDYAVNDIQRIFGCFVRSLPLRLGHSKDPVNAMAVQKVYEEAMSHPLNPSEILRAAPIGTQLKTLLGSQYFMTHINLKPFEDLKGTIQMDLKNSQTQFYPSNGDTDIFLTLKEESKSLTFDLAFRSDAILETQAKALIRHLQSDFISPPLYKNSSSPLTYEDNGPLNAALISYLPSIKHIQRVMPMGESQIHGMKKQFFKGKDALWLDMIDSPLGKTGSLVLPFFADEIRPDKAAEILPIIHKARQMALNLGAKVVSLAGMLPALSSYGRDLPSFDGPQKLTTGHTATVVAMLKNIQGVLAQRTIQDLTYVSVGLGSIGQATLMALLKTTKHPKKIILVDRNQQQLRNFAQDLKMAVGYKGPIECLESRGLLPLVAYDADLVIAAVSSAKVIEIEKLKPGTVVVDDSFPHCFDVPQAIARMKSKKDITVMGGGLLQLENTQRTLYLPWDSEPLKKALHRSLIPDCMPGCQFESLLLSKSPELTETLGLVSLAQVLAYEPVITSLGVGPAPLHLEGYFIQ